MTQSTCHHTGTKHKHHHVDAKPQNGMAFIIAIILNTVFVILEFCFGFIANSTALMADAGHNLSDVLGLLLAWGAILLTRKAPSERYTYGLRSSSILAALANAMLLLVACGAIAWEAIERLQQVPVIEGSVVSLVAGAGIIVNGFSAWLFIKGSKEDLNIRGAFMHMAADALVSLAVVIVGLLMRYGSWYWLDPVTTLLIVLVIVIGTWGLLRDSMRLALNAVPNTINADAITNYLCELPGVTDCHDLHIWGLSTTECALTAHLVMPGSQADDNFIDTVVLTLKEKYSIHHCTLQIEQGSNNHVCSLAAHHHAKHSH